MEINKKKKFSINNLFADDKTRKRNLFLCILPFLIAILVFGVIAFRSIKSILSLATGKTDSKYIIENGDYLLRSTATELQENLYSQLKDYLDKGVEHTDEQLAESICNNFVADFYTWTNKAGQYDVGGMYYVFAPQRSAIYMQARDTVYKYINEYIDDYGAKNLLEVETISSIAKKADQYAMIDVDNNALYFDAFEVTTTWTYKTTQNFDESKYPTSAKFVVINNDGRYELVEAE